MTTLDTIRDGLGKIKTREFESHTLLDLIAATGSKLTLPLLNRNLAFMKEEIVFLRADFKDGQTYKYWRKKGDC